MIRPHRPLGDKVTQWVTMRLRRVGSTAAGSGWLLGGLVLASSSPAAPPPAVFPFDAGVAKAHQQAWAVFLGRPPVTTNSVGMSFVLIPPGQFAMGSPAPRSWNFHFGFRVVRALE